MSKKTDSIKLSFLLPSSKTYVSSEGVIRRALQSSAANSSNSEELGDKKTQSKQIQNLEKRVARLQSIHDRLDSIIAELEEFLTRN